MMGPQQPVAQSMKGANPHAARINRQHGRHACDHLACSLVGEGDRQNAKGADLPRLDQPRHPRGQDPGLATTGACQHKGMAGWKGDGFALWFVELIDHAA